MPGNKNVRFGTLVEPHLDALFRAAWRLVRNRADAEDLVQETCLRACGRLDELKESAGVKGWLLRVMHNVFVDGVRRARLSPIETQQKVVHLASAVACANPTPEQSLDNGQRLEQLERAWEGLDRGHRALLALRAEGYTLAEISVITNLGKDALTMRLYRARQSLARCLLEERSLSNVLPMGAAK